MPHRVKENGSPHQISKNVEEVTDGKESNEPNQDRLRSGDIKRKIALRR